uniref:Sox C-terminal domain-containing protein n=1 Tax=Panagrellus redivivus TaxID=6233 RepID=A0A7E4VLE9_PANRE
MEAILRFWGETAAHAVLSASSLPSDRDAPYPEPVQLAQSSTVPRISQSEQDLYQASVDGTPYPTSMCPGAMFYNQMPPQFPPQHGYSDAHQVYFAQQQMAQQQQWQQWYLMQQQQQPTNRRPLPTYPPTLGAAQTQ